MNDLIVIGGGLAGLAAAAWSARAGLRVALLERASSLGGRARTDVHAGFAHNLGAHALYVGRPAYRGLRDLGVLFTGAPPPGPLLGLRAGEVHRYPAGFFSMLATDLFGFGEKVEAARALMKLTRTDAASLRDVPWGTWLDETVTSPSVRAAIHAVARVTTYAHAPAVASAGVTIAQIKAGGSPGVLYLDDGWQTLVDGLERAALDAGVRIVRDAAATAVTVASSARTEGAEVTVVSGGAPMTLAAPAVILAVGPATARVLLHDDALGAGLLATHAACLDLGLSDLPRPDRPVAFGIDQPVYLSVHSAVARLAARGATVHLMKYLRPGQEDEDAAGAEAELEAVADRVQPGWRDRVVVRRFLPKLVTSNALAAAGIRRPPVDAPRARRVFLAGDWVGEEGLLADAAIASARAASNRVVEELRGTPRPSAAAPRATVAVT